MNIDLTPDQEAFVQQAIAAGRLNTREDAVRQALALWEERERKRAEIIVAVEKARASLARGEGRIITAQSAKELADDIKRKGRAMLRARKRSRS